MRLRRAGPTRSRRERVDARADLADVELVGRRVALFDDSQHPPVGRPDDAAVAGRVVHHAGEQRRRVPVGDVRGDQLVERLGTQQRRVAGQHDDDRVVVVVARQGAHADRGRIAGTTLFGLLDEHDVRPRRRQLEHLLGDELGAVADDHGGARRMELLERVDDVDDHRSATDPVQWFGPAGTHARSFAGGEDDRGDCHADLRYGPWRQ